MMGAIKRAIEKRIGNKGILLAAATAASKLLHGIYEPIRFQAAWMLKGQRMGSINPFEQRICSQNGEERIIKAIFKQIGTTNRYFVEFGAGEGKECNTRNLQLNGWQGLMMDGRDNGEMSRVKREFVTAENINKLFKKYGVPKEFDLLVIDVDGNDYWLWKALKEYSPRAVVIEFNAGFGMHDSKTIKYEPKFSWDGTNYYGASLYALYKLGKQKGYELVGIESRNVNAFFVRKDVAAANFEIRTCEQIYRPSNYGRIVNGVRIGHPISSRKFVEA